MSPFRVPVALVAAGTLLSACAAGAATTQSPARTSRPTATTGTSAVGRAATAPRTGPASTPAPTSGTSLQQLMASGTVSTTAALPTITARALTPAGVLPLGLTPAVRPAAKPGKVVYLTFDDGTGVYSPAILALLEKYHAHATFFVIGRQANSAKHFVGREYAAGNGVGDHTWNHRSLAHMSHKQFLSEVRSTANVIREATGHAPVCLRPPGGAIDQHTRAWAKALGLSIQLWTIDTGDWRRPGAKKISNTVLHHVRDGSVVLMHDGGGDRSQTVAALRTILQVLTARGYSFEARCR